MVHHLHAPSGHSRSFQSGVAAISHPSSSGNLRRLLLFSRGTLAHLRYATFAPLPYPPYCSPSSSTLLLQALTTHLQGLATSAKTDKAKKTKAKEMMAGAVKQRIAKGKRDKTRAQVQAKVKHKHMRRLGNRLSAEKWSGSCLIHDLHREKTHSPNSFLASEACSHLPTVSLPPPPS